MVTKSTPTIAQLFWWASACEATVPKPGNVSPGRAFDDLTFEDLIAAASAAAPYVGRATGSTLGRSIGDATAASQRAAGTNANLGIVLLAVPLAAAAQTTRGASLRDAVEATLSATTIDDAAAVYEAIAIAAPGGLGQAAEGDIASGPNGTLQAMMTLASDRDAVARQYVAGRGYADVAAIAAELRTLHASTGRPFGDDVAALFAATLARQPDTLVARKNGEDEAEAVRQRVESLCGGDPRQITAAAVAAVDATLRTPDHRLNPGATADLFAAALFWALLEDASPDGGVPSLTAAIIQTVNGGPALRPAALFAGDPTRPDEVGFSDGRDAGG